MFEKNQQHERERPKDTNWKITAKETVVFWRTGKIIINLYQPGLKEDKWKIIILCSLAVVDVHLFIHLTSIYCAPTMWQTLVWVLGIQWSPGPRLMGLPWNIVHTG